MQKHDDGTYPVAYISRKLLPQEQRYSKVERVLALVLGNPVLRCISMDGNSLLKSTTLHFCISTGPSVRMASLCVGLNCFSGTDFNLRAVK
ncbi:hypothetical protein PoB_004708600 [Plakobranchus ocellatus]|uniref:Reverse transcriptase RNase H-like domain-containing protein n=1 Tax=Plakobranchus ocellatus TaxID=259542 RepID=A0AAV4BNJ0_9GAST|nr:hypothetical protein PoB_004708600 [Plakobranchus ocellatus]